MARERDDDYDDDDLPAKRSRSRDDDDDERPARRGGGGSGEPIKNYLVQSVLVTLCCCLPLGIVGIINSSKVNGLVAEGKMSEALEASAAAKKWSTYGAIAGVIGMVVGGIGYGILGVLLVGAGANAK